MSSDEENFSIPSRPPDPSDEPETEDESADEVKTEPPRAVFIAGDPEGRTLGDEYADDEAGSTGKGILEDLIDRGEADRRASRNRRRPLNDPPADTARGAEAEPSLAVVAGGCVSEERSLIRGLARVEALDNEP